MANFDGFRKNGKKTNLKGILGNYRMNYLKEFDLYIDIVLTVYMFFKVMWEDDVDLFSLANQCPAKRFGHTLTNQQAERIDFIFF